MRFDSEERTLSIGIRDLVGPELGRLGIGHIPDRAAIGQRLHAEYRRASEAADRAYQGEVSLAHTLCHRGYKILIQGRIDGWRESGGTLVIEEFKSVALEAAELKGLSIHELPAARLQLGMYLFLLELKGYSAVRGVLIVCSIYEPDTPQILPVESFSDEINRYIRSRLDELIDGLEAQECWLSQRREVGSNFPFPFDTMRPIQHQMIQEVEPQLHAGESLLLDAATGSGKTAAVLYAALKQGYQTNKRVFFVTGKTTGQMAAIDTLRRLSERTSVLTSVVLTARDKICPQPVVYCHRDFCELSNRYHERLRRSRALELLKDNGVCDRHQISMVGEEYSLCPFELSLDLATCVDVVICDYNYVFGPNAALKRILGEKNFDDWILIIDEAHNLVDRSRSYYSPTLTWRSCRLLEGWGEKRGDRLGRRIAELALEIQAYFWECLEEACLSEVEDGRNYFVPAIDRLISWRQQLASLLMDDPLRRQWHPLPGEEDVLLSFYRHLADFTEVSIHLDEHSSAFVERDHQEVRLKILCHNASNALRRRLSGFHSVIAMSATLSPMEFYYNMLGFDVRTPWASLPSPFPAKRRGIFVVADVDVRYRERTRALPGLTKVIQAVASSRPGRYAVFVPSFEFLGQIRASLDGGQMEILIQDSRMDDSMRSLLMRRMEEPLHGHGHFQGFESRLLMGVQGGSFSEGIEWSPGKLDGIIVVGPGLPRMDFEQELHRGYFDEQYGAGFEYAYVYPGMTRVIQSAGRLIRRDEDRGVIVLVDRRFAKQQYTGLFPADWYSSGISELTTAELPDALQDFWRGVEEVASS